MTNFKKTCSIILVSLKCMTATLFAHGTVQPTRAQERIVVLENEQVTLVNPFVRKAKKGQNSAAFVVLQNNRDVGRRIIKAASPVATTVELHTSFEEEGVHKMRPVDFIDLPPKAADRVGEVELKSGGYHVMLIDLKHDLEAGKEVPVTLEMSDGALLTTSYRVKGCCGHCHTTTK